MFDESKGRSIQKFRIIGYYPTKKAALQALAEYNKRPASSGTADITFSDVYELWRERNEPKLGRSVFTGYRMAYRVSVDVHNMKMHEIRTNHLQAIMDAYDNGVGSQKRLKTLWRKLFRLAMERDIVSKDYAEFVTLKGVVDDTPKRRPFTKDEIKLLWDNVDKYAGIAPILVMIYTGVRPSELLSIDASHVHLSERWIDLYGTKTQSARRAVPIHRDIIPLIERLLGENHLIQMPDTGRRVQYSHFLRRYWNDSIVDGLGLKGLTPHSCRHTAVTLMVEAGIDDRLLKKIVGHSSGSVTDIYTHAFLETIVREIDKIKI